MRNDYSGRRRHPDDDFRQSGDDDREPHSNQDWRTQDARYGPQRYSGWDDRREGNQGPYRDPYGRSRNEWDRGAGSRSTYDDSFRNPGSASQGRGYPSPYWQGGGTREEGQWRDQRGGFEGPENGRGSQAGRGEGHGGSYERGLGHGQGFSADYDRGDDYGRSNAPEPYEDARSYPYPGVRAARWGGDIHSRSADPGQSSYGGFTNENPRRQRQLLDHYSAGPEDAYPISSRFEEQQGGPYGERRISPKGYRRSDERLREDICERLSHTGLDVSEVSVDVSQGRVTLQGQVWDRRTKHAIEDCADDCMGVQEVDNRIAVRRNDESERDRSAPPQNPPAHVSGAGQNQTDGAQSGARSAAAPDAEKRTPAGEAPGPSGNTKS